ncbi:unnamed protein product [Nippostrongylus brasiliensis]|uniref:Formin-like protein 20 n=1 Tax=Nippostrongylus brasiliensis TaxID=27835 RepID=A0A0N4XXV0_NIPBR|nr:unnamed protein product [Nippostrongylus brasiliensis]
MRMKLLLFCLIAIWFVFCQAEEGIATLAEVHEGVEAADTSRHGRRPPPHRPGIGGRPPRPPPPPPLRPRPPPPPPPRPRPPPPRPRPPDHKLEFLPHKLVGYLYYKNQLSSGNGTGWDG